MLPIDLLFSSDLLVNLTKMMTSIALFFSTDDDDDSDSDETKKLVFTQKALRQRSNPFDFSDAEFVRKFRMSKKAFRYVYEQISLKIKTHRSTAIPPLIKLATTLRVLAEDSFQHSAGYDLNLGLAQPTVSKIFKEVVDILEIEICPKWITFNMSDTEKAEAKLYFFEKTGFPGIIGCIDGMHIKIAKPKKDDEQHLFLNRFNSYSLNVMIVCDHKMYIRYIDARHHGCNADALIWNSSELRAKLNQNFRAGERNTWLLGDLKYPLEPFLITPFRDAEVASPESCFNSTHENARNTINKTVAALKNRFRCLLGTRLLHYEPIKVTKITNVCAALHNICIHFDGATNFVDDPCVEAETATELEHEVYYANSNDELAASLRNQIMDAMVYLKSEPQ